jgi:hypothetical protein
MPAGSVVGDERVIEAAWTSDGQELCDAGARGGEVMLDPSISGGCVGEAIPDVQGIGDGVRCGIGGFGIFFNCRHG